MINDTIAVSQEKPQMPGEVEKSREKTGTEDQAPRPGTKDSERSKDKSRDRKAKLKNAIDNLLEARKGFDDTLQKQVNGKSSFSI